MFIRPSYHLTFLGEPEREHGPEKDLPVGEEIARLLESELPRRGLPTTAFEEGHYCWEFLVELGDYFYTVEIIRPFEALGRDEWLAIITPNIGWITFLGKPQVEPEIVTAAVRKVLEESGRYYSFKTFIKGRRGGAPWREYPA